MKYTEALKTERPKAIVVQESHYDSTISDFLENNNYSLYWSQNNDNMDGALIFLRP